jgi:diaminopimelate epimerase
MVKKIKFYKMHGTGNDYVFIDCFNQSIEDPVSLSKQVSDRHFGIGSDGLVLILPSAVADCKMDIYNADGSRAEMCGNAIRCVGKYLFEKGMADSTRIRVETLSGIRSLKLYFEHGFLTGVMVDMGEPVFDPKLIPVRWQESTLPPEIPIIVKNRSFSATILSMGNPHAVIFTDRLSDKLIKTYGPLIETHDAFPRKTNVEFVRVVDRKHIIMRVWERGSKETLSCGTGACASVVAGILRQKTERNVFVSLPGGTLQIFWDPENNHIFMTGPAVMVYQGIIEI